MADSEKPRIRVPFNMKYRPQLESGEYTLSTRDGRSARIVCWDAKNYGREDDIIAMVGTSLGGEAIQRYSQSGKLVSNMGSGHNVKWDLIVEGDIEVNLDRFQTNLKKLFEDKFGKQCVTDIYVSMLSEDMFNLALQEAALRGIACIDINRQHECIKQQCDDTLKKEEKIFFQDF